MMDEANWFEGMKDYRKEADKDDKYFPEGTVHEDVFFYTGDFNFVWDKAKSDKNMEDHGIDFRTAALVFNTRIKSILKEKVGMI